MSVERLTFDSRLLLFIVLIFHISFQRWRWRKHNNAQEKRKKKHRSRSGWRRHELSRCRTQHRTFHGTCLLRIYLLHRQNCSSTAEVSRRMIPSQFSSLLTTAHKKWILFSRLSGDVMRPSFSECNVWGEKRSASNENFFSILFRFGRVDQRERERVSRLIKLKETIKIRPAQLGSFFFLWVYKMF